MSVDSAAKQLQALNIKTPAPEKLPSGTIGQPIEIVSNTWTVDLKPNTPFFLYDIRMCAVFERKDGEAKRKEITKQTKDDYTEQERKSAAVKAFKALMENKTLTGTLIYDRAALLISLNKLKGLEEKAVFKLTKSTAPKLFALTSLVEAFFVEVAIQPAETFSVTSNDISSQQCEALLEVVNLATSQHVFLEEETFVVYGTGNAYLLDHQSNGFPKVNSKLTNDKYLGVGMNKGARLIEGTAGKPQLAVCVDVKKTAFHVDYQPLNEKMASLGCGGNVRFLSSLLAGLRCVTFYPGVPRDAQRMRVMAIGSVTNTSVGQATFVDREGKTVKLTDYIKKTYNTTIKDPNLPVIVDRVTKAAYSPECLLVAPNQRVKTDHAEPSVIQMLIKESAILPSDRKAQTEILFKSLDINSAKQKERGIVAANKPIMLRGRVLDPVSLVFGNKIQTRANGGSWRMGLLARPAKIANWALVYLHPGPHSDINLNDFVSSILRAAKPLGMAVNAPNIGAQQLAPSNRQDEQLFFLIEQEKKRGSTYVMLISDERVKNHATLKAAEHKYQVATQQMRSYVVRKFGPKTAENVLLKMNEKNGGQNVALAKSPTMPAWIFDKATMIVGLTIQHPRQMTKDEVECKTQPGRPVIFGWGLNAVKGADNSKPEMENFHFASHFGFANPKETKLEPFFKDQYREEVKRMLRNWKAARGCVPMRILLVRGGVAEGDSQKIRDEEVAVWNEAFKAMNEKYSPHFVIISANVIHADRFYKNAINPQDRAPAQNLPSGTVVDKVLTNPGQNEAFIQSHVPLQGTAKVPKYVLQYKSSPTLPFTNDDMQTIIYGLAHLHGVCSSATALPTPLYLANEGAKRATDQFVYFSRSKSQWTIADLCNELVYTEGHALSGIRFNA